MQPDHDWRPAADADLLHSSFLIPQSSLPANREAGWSTDRRGQALLELARIVEDPHQPRETFDEEKLDGLASSVKRHGILNAVLVRWDQEQGHWMLIGGARRRRAALAAGLTAIPARRVEGEPTATDLLEQRIAEQLLGDDWTMTEESQAIVEVMASRGWNGLEAARALGLSTSRISRARAFHLLPAATRARVDAGKLSLAAALKDKGKKRLRPRSQESGDRSQEKAGERRPANFGGPGFRRYIDLGGGDTVIVELKGTFGLAEGERAVVAALEKAIDKSRTGLPAKEAA